MVFTTEQVQKAERKFSFLFFISPFHPFRQFKLNPAKIASEARQERITN